MLETDQMLPERRLSLMKASAGPYIGAPEGRVAQGANSLQYCECEVSGRRSTRISLEIRSLKRWLTRTAPIGVDAMQAAKANLT